MQSNEKWYVFSSPLHFSRVSEFSQDHFWLWIFQIIRKITKPESTLKLHFRFATTSPPHSLIATLSQSHPRLRIPCKMHCCPCLWAAIQQGVGISHSTVLCHGKKPQTWINPILSNDIYWMEEQKILSPEGSCWGAPRPQGASHPTEESHRGLWSCLCITAACSWVVVQTRNQEICCNHG